MRGYKKSGQPFQGRPQMVCSNLVICQAGTCRGGAPPSCCRKTVRSLKSPTGAFIVPLRSTNANLSGVRPLHLAAARPFGHLKAPLGLSLFRFAPQTRTCRGEAPPSCCRKTVLSLKSPTGAFIVPLRSTSANFYFCCHVITYSFSPVASSKPLC